MSLPTPLSVLGLAVTFALPLVGFYRRRTARETLDWPRLRRALLRNWVALAALVSLVAAAGDLRDLGLRTPSVGVLVDGLLFGFVAFAGAMLLVGLLLSRTGDLTADAASLVAFDQPPSRRLAVAVTGAVVECVLFYGFTVETLLGFGTGPWVAGAVAAAGVLLVRLQWGPRNALQWLPGAVVLAGITVWARTALVALLVRLVYDTITLVSGNADDYASPADA